MDQHIYQTQNLILHTALLLQFATSSQSNIGDMTTKGINRFGLVPIKTESFKWDTFTHPIDLLSTPLLLEQMR
jgi:hypothetical protein